MPSLGGHLVREARLRAGLTQAELAARMGTTQSAVARWERAAGDIGVDKLQEAVVACGLQLAIGLDVYDDSDAAVVGQVAKLSPNQRARRHSAVAAQMHSIRTGNQMVHAPRFDAILRTLVDHDVEFVVIGGFAAMVAGSPFPTEDIDITPRATLDNMIRLSAALKAMEAHLRVPDGDPVPFAHDGESLATMRVLTLTTAFGSLDVSVIPSGTAGYDDLAQSAVTHEVLGVAVAIASLADVIRSKEAAGRDKDRRVLPTLRDILRRQTRGN